MSMTAELVHVIEQRLRREGFTQFAHRDLGSDCAYFIYPCIAQGYCSDGRTPYHHRPRELYVAIMHDCNLEVFYLGHGSVTVALTDQAALDKMATVALAAIRDHRRDQERR
jgi:hypothetical protein